MFKVGDKVICIDNDGTKEMLIKSKVYTVKDISGELVRLNNNYGLWFNKRFAYLTESEPKGFRKFAKEYL